MPHRLILITIILIAFALRLFRLDQQSLWYDEGFTWLLSQMELSSLIEWTARDIQPPFYYLVIWASTMLFGASEYALRFPSALFGTLSVPLMFVVARKLGKLQEKTHRDKETNVNPTSSLFFTSYSYIAMFITAIAPIMVYYSQETRMYALLILQAILSSYLLLRILHPSIIPIPYPVSRIPYPIPLAYILINTSALYTHYFAVFLLISHASYLMLIGWQFRFKRVLLRKITIMFGGIGLFFTPWLPILLARWGDDPSYWQGSLKLNEAIRKIAISFSVGETVFEHEGFWLALGYGLLVGFSIFNLRGSNCNVKITQDVVHSKVVSAQNNGNQGKQDKPTFIICNLQFTIFIFLWLLIPIIGILLLSYQSPKFNPRYTLIAWPAFALLIANGITNLAHFPIPRKAIILSRIPYLLALIALAFIISTSVYSLTNWFTKHEFTKDDWQALAQFVQERQAEDETVLLSSGHAFPVWAYYYGWSNWTSLPNDMPTLDINRLITLEIAEPIHTALQNKGGVWLVNWQEEVIDPNGVVPFLLDSVGQRPVDAGDFWGVRLEHWRLTQPNKLKESPIAWPQLVNFNHQLDLLGQTQISDSELVLFWRAKQTLPEQVILTLNLTDDEGHDWSKESLSMPLGASAYPTSRWPIGEVIITRHQLPWQIGTPPGLYIAEVELGTVSATDNAYQGWDILDEQGNPQRRTALLEPINLSDLVEPTSGPLNYATDPVIDFFPIIALRKAILPKTSAEPGDRILLALLWQAGEFNLDDISLTFELIDKAEQTHFINTFPTPSRHFNLSRWQPRDMVLGQYWLDIPPEVMSGMGTLQVRLINQHGFRYDEQFSIGSLEILPTTRNFTPPEQFDLPLEADFSGKVTLLGLNCSNNCQTKPGESLTLTAYWRAKSPLEVEYTIFAHLLNHDEKILINADHAPPKSSRAWVVNEVITDPVTLNIPVDLPPGDYLFEIGLYDANDPAFTRLPLVNGETRVLLSDLITVK